MAAASNWVERRFIERETARRNVRSAFEELRLGVKFDLDQIKTSVPRTPFDFEFIEGPCRTRFVVMRHRTNESASIEFGIAGDRIEVSGFVSLEAMVVVDDSGKRSLQVNDQTLKVWQFREKALEDFIFEGS